MFDLHADPLSKDATTEKIKTKIRKIQSFHKLTNLLWRHLAEI